MKYKTCISIIEKVLDIVSQNTIVLGGGVAPYFNLNLMSSRDHQDIDFYVDINNMEKLKKELEKFYSVGYYSNNGKVLNMQILINDELVEFLPLEFKDNGMYTYCKRYNYKLKKFETKTVFLPDLTYEEVYEQKQINNKIINITKVDFCYAFKYGFYESNKRLRKVNKKDLKILKKYLTPNADKLILQVKQLKEQFKFSDN